MLRPFPAIVIAVATLTGAGACLAFGPHGWGLLAFWSLAVGPTLVLGAAAALWANREALIGAWLAPRWGDFTLGLLGAVALYGVSWAFARAVAPVGAPREIWLASVYGILGDPRVLRAHGAVLFLAAALAALSEEMVWRGMVTRLVAQRVGSRVAWVWAAVLYALAYVPTAFVLPDSAGPNPLLVLVALAGGVLWGAMARAFGRLMPSVLSHALYDCAVVMLFPLWGPEHRI